MFECSSFTAASRQKSVNPELHAFRLQVDLLGQVVVEFRHRCEYFSLAEFLVRHLVSENRGCRTAEAPIGQRRRHRAPDIVWGPMADAVLLEQILASSFFR